MPTIYRSRHDLLRNCWFRFSWCGFNTVRYLLCGLAIVVSAQNVRIENLAPYTPTPQTVVEKMLDLAELKPGEKMFDLGSGDGRIVISAARNYHAVAVGVEFDETLVRRSASEIARLALTERARIIQGDLMKQDYSSADVVTVYLLPIGNIKLIPILEKQLRKGARIVSHNAEFPGWTPAKTVNVEDDGQGKSHRLYLYKR
jgi:protein-L-isoaspartate O-methyltransferase